MSFGVKDGYVERETPEYWVDDKSLLCQPDVYWYAFGIAVELGASGIVDVGCGQALKLATLQTHRPDWRFVGIDYGENISQCETYGWGEWLSIDLERPHSYDATDAVIVCADVVEHLVDPSELLNGIRDSGCAAAVLSTPERDLTWGQKHNGPPPNPCHVREWNRDEFEALLGEWGFEVTHLGLTRSDDEGTGDKTILARVTA